jgi:hypothetical protein
MAGLRVATNFGEASAHITDVPANTRLITQPNCRCNALARGLAGPNPPKGVKFDLGVANSHRELPQLSSKLTKGQYYGRLRRARQLVQPAGYTAQGRVEAIVANHSQPAADQPEVMKDIAVEVGGDHSILKPAGAAYAATAASTSFEPDTREGQTGEMELHSDQAAQQ